MEQVRSRREQYVESTRAALLEAGRRHFAERGFADVSAEELVRAAGLTRGALYHHFAGKQGLFEAVFEEFEDRAAARIAAAVAAAGDDPWLRGVECVRAFLDICSEPEYRQIVLLQGPIALGWQRWRELDQRHLGALLEESLNALLGAAPAHPLRLTAAALYGALTELALSTAEADDPARAREQAVHLVSAMLKGLRTFR
ncbi:TetR/AcrR family transcriptional regulator [Actinomadura opuntiae]|uniref:TetR/AcrR family transcriptional regulator n=1 Tax=Actinomadura sp. OS1-43 TaxID=604315 RepID=UPI00255B2601|nr:TetR/AcrR family transcriptional regulator [Actinomadura sp. OS1-43]MDL4816982.1 helix-turn-helix domain-containing protein [Actinomadura sp. OS1-43]